MPEIPLGDEKLDGGLRLLNTVYRRTPFLVWEVVDSQPLSHMIEKISHYFKKSHGLIRIVVVIQLIRQCPPKRKRRPSSIGDESDTGASSRVAEDIDEGEPVLPQPPPPGRLLQGFYWVYRHARNPAGKRAILCPIERQLCSPLSSPSRSVSYLTPTRNSTPPRLSAC